MASSSTGALEPADSLQAGKTKLGRKLKLRIQPGMGGGENVTCSLCVQPLSPSLRNLHRHRLITPIIIIQKKNSSCGGPPIPSLHKAISVHFSNSQRAWLPSTTWMPPSHQSSTLGQKLMCVVAARRSNLNSYTFPETSWAAQIQLMNFQATKFLFVQVFWKNP